MAANSLNKQQDVSHFLLEWEMEQEQYLELVLLLLVNLSAPGN
jgi:hypothetical protein